MRNEMRFGLLALILVASSLGTIGFAQEGSGTSLEDQQQAAGVIVTKATELASLDHGLIRMSDLLKDASPEAKAEFLDSLVLVDGKVASVSFDRMQHEVGVARMHKVLLTIFPERSSNRSSVSDGVQTKTLCDEHYCYGAACTGGAGHTYCKTVNNSGACGGGC